MAARFNKQGNTKIGRIWSFSTLMGNEPIHISYRGTECSVMGTCGKYCEGCKKACYVRHSYRYPSVKYGHMLNTLAIRNDTMQACYDLRNQIMRAKNKPNAIRIHVSGEFESLAEIAMWDILAATFPDIVFYVYSKAYDLLDEYYQKFNKSPNFIWNVSIWHEYGILFYRKYAHVDGVRCFVYDDGYDYRKWGLYSDSKCPAYDANGNTVDGVTCEKCGLCMGKRNRNVTFCNAH